MTNFADNYSTAVTEFDAAPIPYELQDLVNNELENGETIEWIDQPVPSLFSGKEEIGQFLFAIPWTAFAVFWTYMAAKSPSLLFPLFGIPFILIGIWLLSAPLNSYKNMRRTVYVITNRRVITFEGKRNVSNITCYEPDELDEIKRIQKKNGTGNIFVFNNIRNVKGVEKKLRKLKSFCKPENVEY